MARKQRKQRNTPRTRRALREAGFQRIATRESYFNPDGAMGGAGGFWHELWAKGNGHGRRYFTVAYAPEFAICDVYPGNKFESGLMRFYR